MHKTIGKDLTSKYSHATATEATGDVIGNKIAVKIKRVSKNSPQNNSKENIEHDRKIHKERYISPEQRHKIINDLRLV